MAREKFNEDTLSEQPAIKQLREKLGYDYIHGDQLDPDLIENCERKSRKDVILEGRLKKKLAEINPRLTRETIDKAVRKITHIQDETTLEANRIFHKYLISGDSLDQDVGARRRKVTVNFIDFKEVDKNEFLDTSQKPRPFKGGDEWLPEAKPVFNWLSVGIYGIIWLWPDIGLESIQSTDCNTILYGSQSIGSGSYEAK